MFMGGFTARDFIPGRFLYDFITKDANNFNDELHEKAQSYKGRRRMAMVSAYAGCQLVSTMGIIAAPIFVAPLYEYLHNL